jgi:hypothetical protein
MGFVEQLRERFVDKPRSPGVNSKPGKKKRPPRGIRINGGRLLPRRGLPEELRHPCGN